MNKKEVAELFFRGQDCSQVVASAFADAVGMELGEINRINAAFGGGLGVGETCGAVVGAMVVLGLKYGHSGPDDGANRDIMSSKRDEFIRKWDERRVSLRCGDLLGHDLRKPGEFDKVLEEGLLTDLCPELVLDAIDILNEII